MRNLKESYCRANYIHSKYYALWWELQKVSTNGILDEASIIEGILSSRRIWKRLIFIFSSKGIFSDNVLACQKKWRIGEVVIICTTRIPGIYQSIFEKSITYQAFEWYITFFLWLGLFYSQIILVKMKLMIFKTNMIIRHMAIILQTIITFRKHLS